MPSNDAGSFNEFDIKYLQDYIHRLHDLRDLATLYLLRIDSRQPVAENIQCLTWLAIGRQSACIRSALLLHALFPRDRWQNQALEEQLLQYRIKSSSDLRLAISANDYLEIFYSSFLLSTFTLESGLIPLDTVLHLSGAWAALKKLSFESSMTTPQWVRFENFLLSCLFDVWTRLIRILKRGNLSLMDMMKVTTTVKRGISILQELLDWPIPFNSNLFICYEEIRHTRLTSALLFQLLVYAPALYPVRASILAHTDNIISSYVRDLTSVEMQVGLGIHGLVCSLKNVDLNVLPPSANVSGDQRALGYLRHYILCKILQLYFESEDVEHAWNNVMVACYQLIAIWETEITENKAMVHSRDYLNHLVFAASFLSKSRHLKGSNSIEIQRWFPKANRWIRSCIHKEFNTIISPLQLRSLGNLMDRANQCSSAREVLLVQCEDHSVWELIVDLYNWQYYFLRRSAYRPILWMW